MVNASQTRLAEPKAIGQAATLALDRLRPGKTNRPPGKDEEIKGLATSIAAVGLLYPLIVRQSPEADGTFTIIAGERRFRALKRLKAESAPCVIVSDSGENPAPEILRVVENHQRRQLEPLEEAAAIRALLDSGLAIETVARSLGRSRPWIARRSSLAELSPGWVEAIRDPESKLGLWPPAHLEMISRFPPEVQDRILEHWGTAWHWNQPTLADLKAVTGGCLRLLAAAPWKLDDDTLCPEAGACQACPKRSSHAPELFPGELPARQGKPPADDHCLDPACWGRKAEGFLKRRIELARREHPDLLLLNNSEDDEDQTALSDALGAPVVNVWDVVVGRKSDTGAVPALVVAGAGLGRLKWVVPALAGKFERMRKHVADEDGNGHNIVPFERTQEEKKAPYDKRRRQHVIDAVKAKLEALAGEADPFRFTDLEGGKALAARGLLARTLYVLKAMLDDYGWRDSVHKGDFQLPETPAWEDLATLKNHELGQGELRETLLDLALKLLRLAVGRYASRLLVTPGERDNARHYTEAETICALLNLDLSGLRAQAAQAIPYAKCWREEVADEWAAPVTEPEKNSGPTEVTASAR